jgi:hypothetical protein
MSGLQIMQIRCADCVPRNYLQLWYSFLSLKTNIRSPNRPWKIICSDFGLTAQQGFWGLYLIAHLSEMGLSHVQIKGIVETHNFGSQTFAIKDSLSLRICTKRSCCPELREYLSGWVDLVGKHPSPPEFCVLMLRSLDFLEFWSLRVLTCDRRHDLLLKCLMNLSRKSPL